MWSMKLMALACVFLVDFKCSDPCRVINGCVLETPHLFAAFSFEGQELNVNLDLMAGHLFVVSFGVQLAHSCASWKPIETIAPQNSINSRIGDFGAVIAGQVPHDPDRTEVILTAKIEYFIDDLGRRLIGRILWN